MKKILFIFILFTFIGNVTAETTKKKNVKINIVVSIPPQVEFAERVGGNKVEVTAMVPLWASPHTYEPTPSQMRALSSADVYFKMGSDIEFEMVWLSKLIKLNKGMKIIDGSQGIKLIEMIGHGHNDDKVRARKDPHIWLSPINAIKMVNNLRNGLSKIDFKNKNYFTENSEKYIKELTELDKKIRDRIKRTKKTKFFVFHPSWGYFAKEYGLEQIAIEKEGKEPTAKELLNLVKMARESDIKVIFASPQFNTKSAIVFAKEINAQVELLNPQEKEYIKLLDKMSLKLSGADR